MQLLKPPARKIRSRNVFQSFDKHTPLERKTKSLTNAGYPAIQVKPPQKHNRNSHFYKRRKNLSLGVVFLFHVEYTTNHKLRTIVASRNAIKMTLKVGFI